MPGGAVFAEEYSAPLKAEVPEDLAHATVLRTTTEIRERYDFAVTVSRIELEVEKKIIEDVDGQRHVITASTSEWGLPRYSVTWNALATLAVLVGQFALPLNRLATLVSTSPKRFTAGALGRLLHMWLSAFCRSTWNSSSSWPTATCWPGTTPLAGCSRSQRTSAN